MYQRQHYVISARLQDLLHFLEQGVGWKIGKVGKKSSRNKFFFLLGDSSKICEGNKLPVLCFPGPEI